MFDCPRSAGEFHQSTRRFPLRSREASGCGHVVSQGKVTSQSALEIQQKMHAAAFPALTDMHVCGHYMLETNLQQQQKKESCIECIIVTML